MSATSFCVYSVPSTKPKRIRIICRSRSPSREMARAQHLAVGVVLQGADDLLPVRAEDVREQQFVAVVVRVQRLVEADFRLLRAVFAQVHEDLVLDAAGA